MGPGAVSTDTLDWLDKGNTGGLVDLIIQKNIHTLWIPCVTAGSVYIIRYLQKCI